MAIAISLGCSESLHDQSSVTGPTDEPRSHSVQSTRLTGTDSLFSAIEDSIPGFAGYYYGEPGSATVMLVNGSVDTARAVAVLRRRVPGARFSSAAVRFRTARYSFKQLAHWKHVLTLHIPPATSEFVFIDADELRNRVIVGVAGIVGEVAVTEALQSLGVPSGLVETVIVGRVNVLQSLTSSLRPTVGGLGISINSETGPTCTLGYNVRLNSSTGTKYGLTNSHCTATAGGTEGTVFNQAQSPSSIGTEYQDPVWWTSGCPSGFVCRYSDAAFFSYTNQSDAKAAALARPSGGPNGGSLTLDALNPELPVTDQISDPVTGDSTSYPQTAVYQLHKIGKSSGWTAGYLNRTCVNVAQSQGGVPTNRILLCQHVVRAGQAEGDSGAPVFSVDNINWPASQWEARAFGILWGGQGTGSASEFFFSDLTGIEADMSGYKCYGCP